ncbi:MAG: Rrf2 family transcriptional regulator [candidate division Zixibacteria bacterium]|nr:Rrf2 family transcriptional regulator [candidate division Zixibacteria bacterium]
MQFTKAEEYGIYGIMYLASQPKGRITPLSEISENQKVPEKFLAKIFQSLSHSGLVRSHRGVKGGFTLGRPSEQITVKDVVESIQGPYQLSKSLTEPSGRQSPAVASLCCVLREAQEKLLAVFSNHTIKDLTDWQS